MQCISEYLELLRYVKNRSCEREAVPIASLELDGWQDSFGLMHNGPRDPNDYHYELLADA